MVKDNIDKKLRYLQMLIRRLDDITADSEVQLLNISRVSIRAQILVNKFQENRGSSSLNVNLLVGRISYIETVLKDAAKNTTLSNQKRKV